MSRETLDRLLEAVKPSRRDLLKRLLLGGTLALVPMSSFLEAAEQGDQTTPAKGKGKAKKGSGKKAGKGKKKKSKKGTGTTTPTPK